jgi:hypothetical protein
MRQFGTEPAQEERREHVVPREWLVPLKRMPTMSAAIGMMKQGAVLYHTFGLPEPDFTVEPPAGGEWWIFSGMDAGLDGTIYSGL